MEALFDNRTRTDGAPATPNESLYRFLDRSGRPFFGEVRRLLIEWLAMVPAVDRPSLMGSLKSGDNHAFSSAFWELYLHEAYRRSGHTVTIHPAVANSSNHPDFLIEGNDARFYVEAVRVNVAADQLAESRRLNEVHAVLDAIQPGSFLIGLSHYTVGMRPLRVRELRQQLKNWLDSLNMAQVMDLYSRSGSLPYHSYKSDGWDLRFEARPQKAGAAGGRFVGTFGPGEAQMVDNITGLRRAFDTKANRYGPLDAPLVIAAMANTEFATDDYEVEQALFGRSARRPRLAPQDPRQLLDDGHWLTFNGWRRRHAPQAIVVQGLRPWHILKVQPRLWATLEPGAVLPTQPSWLAPVDVDGDEPKVGGDQALHSLFGLPSHWLSDDPLP